MEQSRIAAFLPSQQLRDAIRETAHRFTDRELVMIAEQYAPIRKDRMDALETIAEQTDDPDTRKLAERLLAYHREALERFLATEPDTVYVAEIREKPNSYLEHYLCRSFRAAMGVIRGFCEEYAVTLNESSTVEIKKYRVLSEADDFDECELGEVCLTRDLEIASADYWSLEQNHFINADGSAEFIHFPDVLAPYSAVTFKDFRGMQYGLQIKAFRDGKDDDAYVIYLDSESFHSEDLSDFGSAHCHVPIPCLEQIAPERLPEKERENYTRLVDYLRDRRLIEAE